MPQKHLLKSIWPKFGVMTDCAEINFFAISDITFEYINWLNDSTLLQYSNQRFIFYDEKIARSYFDEIDRSNSLFLKILRRQNKKMIGTITVNYNRHHRTADVGILIGAKKYHGEGIGGSAFCAVVDWLCTTARVRKVTAGTLSVNKPMLKILDNSRLEVEYRKVGQELYNGRPVDVIVYAKFPD